MVAIPARAVWVERDPFRKERFVQRGQRVQRSSAAAEPLVSGLNFRSEVSTKLLQRQHRRCSDCA